MVNMDPLAGGPQVDAALAIGDCKPGLRAQRRLVLTADFVSAFDHDVAGGGAVTAAYSRLLEYRSGADGVLRIGERRQLLVLDDDRLHRAASRFFVVGRNDGDRFSPVSDGAVAQHRLVLDFLAERRPARKIFGCQNSSHARHSECRRDIELCDRGMAVRAAQSCPPQHGVGIKIRRVCEVSSDLRHPVGAEDRFADPAGHRRSDKRVARWGFIPRRHEGSAANPSKARRIAP